MCGYPVIEKSTNLGGGMQILNWEKGQMLKKCNKEEGTFGKSV